MQMMITGGFVSGLWGDGGEDAALMLRNANTSTAWEYVIGLDVTAGKSRWPHAPDKWVARTSPQGVLKIENWKSITGPHIFLAQISSAQPETLSRSHFNNVTPCLISSLRRNLIRDSPSVRDKALPSNFLIKYLPYLCLMKRSIKAGFGRFLVANSDGVFFFSPSLSFSVCLSLALLDSSGNFEKLANYGCVSLGINYGQNVLLVSVKYGRCELQCFSFTVIERM